MFKRYFAGLMFVMALWIPAAVHAESSLREQIPTEEFAAFCGAFPEASPSADLASLLGQGLKAYDSLGDYRAIFHKTERSGAELGPHEEIYIKFSKPFKIFMGWLNTQKKGLQVLYQRGRHDDKLAIHQPGLILGLAQVVFLEQSSPWVREGSASYDIEDAGIGSFLYDFTRAVLQGHREKKLKVSPKIFVENNGLAGEKIEVIFEDSKDQKGYFAHRIEVIFDRTNHLPVGMSLYDWDDQPMGFYEYRELKVDVGAEDEDFIKQINRRLLRVYRDDPALKGVSRPAKQNFS